MGGVNDQVPPVVRGLLPQAVSEKRHGRVFSGEMTGIEQPESGILGPSGRGMFHFGGEQHVRSPAQGGLGQVGAGAAANGDGRHLGRSLSGLQYPGRCAGLPYFCKKGFGGQRYRVGAETSESAAAMLGGRDQRLGVRKAERTGQVIADPALDRIEIGMAGDDADAGACRRGKESTDGCVGAKSLQGFENDRMMGDDEIVTICAGLIDQKTGGVQRQEDPVHRLLGIADEKTDIVPVFSEVFRSYLLKDIEKISNVRHSVLLCKEKEAHPLRDVPLF